MNAQTSFTAISASGNALLLTGASTIQYQTSSVGGIAIAGLSGGLFGSTPATNPLRSILTAERIDPFAREHARVVARSIDLQASFNAAILPQNQVEAVPQLNGVNNPLALQLQTVARIIGGRNTLGMRRQVFYVAIGGFDTHDRQNTDLPTLHARVAQAMAYFDRLLASPAVNALADTTLFTGSEFGRTLTSNGDGSDHGWGGHHFVSGGAVLGQRIYGRFPVYASNGPDDVGQGRMIPGTASDQYAATLGKWMGLSAAQLDTVLPNLRNFSTRDLGFLTA